jgi:hypothetical protein
MCLMWTPSACLLLCCPARDTRAAQRPCPYPAAPPGAQVSIMQEGCLTGCWVWYSERFAAGATLRWSLWCCCQPTLSHTANTCCCRRTLATVPLLSKVVSPTSLSVSVSRRLQPGRWQAFDELMEPVQQQQVPLLVLFPGKGRDTSADISLAHRFRNTARQGCNMCPIGPAAVATATKAYWQVLQGVL